MDQKYDREHIYSFPSIYFSAPKRIGGTSPSASNMAEGAASREERPEKKNKLGNESRVKWTSLTTRKK